MRREQRPQDPVGKARRTFEEVTGRAAEAVAFAPGRVNVIGEHTDYNDGFVLPMAIEEGIAAAVGRRGDDRLRVHASDIGETREIPLPVLRTTRPAVTGWFRYAVGMAWALEGAGLRLAGADITIASNLPSGAGLSSSAAFELATARALIAAAGLPWDPRAVALLAQRAEQEFAGVACGIMDQMAVACAAAGRALLLDCRSLETRDVALPPTARIVVMNSGVRRSLASSAYNERRAACERAVAAIRRLDPAVRALRDVDAPLLARARASMDEVAFRRAAHVVAENARPALLADALAAGDLAKAGQAMLDSHASLRDLYEVSCRELDLLVSRASAQPGCHGARLTGAGFGGCAIALVDADCVEPFTREVAAGYAADTGLRTEIIVSRPSAGARLVI